ncbi:TPA: phage tail tape measure protein [Citrobacter amalonaticus]|uniref:phage tail tape measure protein n=1 Tax=Citrobacter amalonaticus TaxID=35703 RepID=UPI0008EE1907|nr:phage tail tape measure protein [Citrobacter amalonaticus]SFA96073.1 phage tail tape measure protein, lambda family [Citrobacter amalonaticus]HAU5593157.1 phage tail tape measure protein [Citrobacter amalonaticus]HBC6429443.1 phage tail tape measure protein [Citrobacter amalonaticus]HCB3234504.1 phage tail tape measure protein [Citrobacter amalonaticus]HDP8882435.1 phage tail tape measure protein [Citrobacter amalonaticus]
MAQTAVGDLVVNLDVNSTKFNEQITHVKRQFRQTGDAANDTELRIRQAFSRQEIAAKKAGLSVGQYSNAMRMLPAQFTDIATQLAGGQSPWLIMLQQGGQVKDSFGGIIPTFRALTGAISPLMVGVGALSVATGALFYSWYQGSSTLSDFNKTLVLSGNSAGLTADRMLVLARNGQSAGLTFSQTSEALTELVNAGVRAGANFDAMSQSVSRFTEVSGVPVDKVAAAFGKLTNDPTSGLIAMAQQFHNVTAEQIAYVAQLQRAGDEAAALQAANDAATSGFNEQTKSLRDNMGTIESAADSLKRAFKSMWDAALDVGRPDTAQEMVSKAEAAFKRADEIWNLRRNDGYVNSEARDRFWNDRETARMALEMAQQQAGVARANEENASREAVAESDRQKYAAQAQANYTKTQSALEKYTQRQNELNKALKEGRILQADYNINMSAAKKEYEDSLKKPGKAPAVKTPSGVRAVDTASAQTIELQAQLRTLQEHRSITDTISQQRQELWRQQSRFTVLEEAAKTRTLSTQEKSLLASKDEVLSRAEVNARLGDQIMAQERLNRLQDTSRKYVTQIGEKTRALVAGGAMSRRAAQRQNEEAQLRQGWLNAGGTDTDQGYQNELAALKNYYEEQDNLRNDWQSGAKSAWADYVDSASDAYGQVKSAATSTLDGISQNMADMLTTGKANWADFTRSTLSMLTQILMKQAMVGLVDSATTAMGFAGGGFTGSGGKYEPAGVVHRGEFVFTKEATSRIGVGNLYRMMKGYASGGLVGGGTAGPAAPFGVSVYAPVTVENPSSSTQQQNNGEALGRAYQQVIKKSVNDGIAKAIQPGGLIWNATKGR